MLGIGVAVYVEVTAGGGATEYGRVEVHDDGTATIAVGTSSHGQGHATSFAMMVADRLGIPMEAIRFVQSDTAVVPRGGGTGGSRSLQIGGNAVAAAAEEVLEQAKELAARELEAAVDDIVVTDDGRVGVAGVAARSALGWARLAQLAATDGGALSAVVDFAQAGATFPFGAHVSVVEVDLDTGLGPAPPPHRRRRLRPDPQPADRDRPATRRDRPGHGPGPVGADGLRRRWQPAHGATWPTTPCRRPPRCRRSRRPTPRLPARSTRLGAKGIGESGTIGSTPAVHNAVVDALSHLGVRHIDMPCTPMRVWDAIVAAESDTLPPLWREPPSALIDLPLRGSTARPEAADVDI